MVGKTRGLTLIAFLLIIFGNVMGQDLARVEAVFITKFLEYVEWPDGKADFTIGVVGNSRVMIELQEIIKAKGKPVIIKKITAMADLEGCKIVFVPENESKNFANIKNSLKGKGVLLVTENQDLATAGASISFFTEAGKLKFIVNKSSLEEEKLKVSSALLSLARVI